MGCFVKDTDGPQSSPDEHPECFTQKTREGCSCFRSPWIARWFAHSLRSKIVLFLEVWLTLAILLILRFCSFYKAICVRQKLFLDGDVFLSWHFMLITAPMQQALGKQPCQGPPHEGLSTERQAKVLARIWWDYESIPLTTKSAWERDTEWGRDRDREGETAVLLLKKNKVFLFSERC